MRISGVLLLKKKKKKTCPLPYTHSPTADNETALLLLDIVFTGKPEKASCHVLHVVNTQLALLFCCFDRQNLKNMHLQSENMHQLFLNLWESYSAPAFLSVPSSWGKTKAWKETAL